MKCYYHLERDAVGTCSQCGKSLCSSCIDIYTPPLCSACAEKINNAERNQITKDIIISIVMIILGCCFYFLMLSDSPSKHFNLFELLVIGIFMGGIPYGWNALSKLTSNLFIFLPIIGWLIYFVIKVTLSLFIGWFFFIVKILKIILRMRHNPKMKSYIDVHK